MPFAKINQIYFYFQYFYTFNEVSKHFASLFSLFFNTFFWCVCSVPHKRQQFCRINIQRDSISLHLNKACFYVCVCVWERVNETLHYLLYYNDDNDKKKKTKTNCNNKFSMQIKEKEENQEIAELEM